MDFNTSNKPGVFTTTKKLGKITEYFITVSLPIDNLQTMLELAYEKLNQSVANPIGQYIFAPLAGNENITLPTDRPVTWIDSGHARGSGLAGVYIHAITGVEVEKIENLGRTVACVYENDDAKYCTMGDLRTEDSSRTNVDQVADTFGLMESVLQQAGMDFSHVCRTWLYLEKILDWYDDFNKARDNFFSSRKTFDILVPASTGIGGANPAQAAMIAGALAVKAKTENFKAMEVDSPLQGSARDYGSSFSRAVELENSDSRWLSISGTASIAPEGHTVHLDDIEKQVDLTMRVVTAIIESRNMQWSDVTRCFAYHKTADYLPVFENWLKASGLENLPIVFTENDVCRDNLLFELEVDAIVAKK